MVTRGIYSLDVFTLYFFALHFGSHRPANEEEKNSSSSSSSSTTTRSSSSRRSSKCGMGKGVLVWDMGEGRETLSRRITDFSCLLFESMLL